MQHNARTTPSPIHFSTQFYAQFNTHSFASAFEFNSRQFPAVFSTLRYYLLYLTRVQFISSFNQCIAFIVPLLTTFLQLKYLGINDQNKSTPFDTHPRAMLVAVSSSIVYYLAYISLLRFPLHRFAVVAHHCLVLSGYTSAASLASVLFSDSISPFVYSIFVLIPASELLYYLHQAYGGRIRRFLNNVCRVVASSFGQQRHILPV